MSLTASLNLSRTESRPTFTNSITINGTGTGGASVETDITGPGMNERARVKLPGKRINRTPNPSSGLTLTPITAGSEDTISNDEPEIIRKEEAEATESVPTPIPSITAKKASMSQSLTQLPAPEPVEHDERVIRFEHRLLEILIAIFSSEAKLVANIVDTSKNIILNKSDLIELISMLTGTSCVDIITAPIITGCLSRFKLYDHIDRIFVDGVDFLITRNAEYNYITQYKVSLDKCFDI
jgi:hypothetical protein